MAEDKFAKLAVTWSISGFMFAKHFLKDLINWYIILPQTLSKLIHVGNSTSVTS